MVVVVVVNVAGADGRGCIAEGLCSGTAGTKSASLHRCPRSARVTESEK